MPHRRLPEIRSYNSAMDLVFAVAALGAVVGAFVPIVIGLSPYLWNLSQPALRRLAWFEAVCGTGALLLGFVGQRWALQPEQGEGGFLSLFIALTGWAMIGLGALIVIPAVALLKGASWGRTAHTIIVVLYAVTVVALMVLPI